MNAYRAPITSRIFEAKIFIDIQQTIYLSEVNSFWQIED